MLNFFNHFALRLDVGFHPVRYLLSQFRWAYILLVAALAFLILYAYSIDINLAIIMALTIIPSIVYIGIVRVSDVGNLEPRGTIALNITAGILLVFPAIYLEIYFGGWVNAVGLTPGNPLTLSNTIFWAVMAFFVVGPVEEWLKIGAFVIVNLLHKENDRPTDSIIYAVAIAGGFALYENYRYITSALQQGFYNGLLLAIMRTITAIPLHLGLGLVIGYYMSKLKFHKHFQLTSAQRMGYVVKLLVIPALIHGLYDFLVFSVYNPNWYLDLLVAIVFAFVLNYQAWKWVIRLRNQGLSMKITYNT